MWMLAILLMNAAAVCGCGVVFCDMQQHCLPASKPVLHMPGTTYTNCAPPNCAVCVLWQSHDLAKVQAGSGFLTCHTPVHYHSLFSLLSAVCCMCCVLWQSPQDLAKVQAGSSLSGFSTSHPPVYHHPLCCLLHVLCVLRAFVPQDLAKVQAGLGLSGFFTSGLLHYNSLCCVLCVLCVLPAFVPQDLAKLQAGSGLSGFLTL